MKLNKIVALMALVLTGSAYAMDDAGGTQMQDLQRQVANLQQQVDQMGQAGAGSSAAIGQISTSPDLMYAMMNNFGSAHHEQNILKAKSSLSNMAFYIGGYTQLGLNSAFANEAVLTHSTGHKSTTNVSLDFAEIGVLANLNQYTAAYLQVGAEDVGVSGTNATFQQAYLLFSGFDLPIYGFAGKKDIDFGNFQTVNMFAQPMTRVFTGVANTAGVGYTAYGFNVEFSVLNGGATGVANQRGAGFWGDNYGTSDPFGEFDKGTYTRVANQLNNFALNATYGMTTEGVDWSVGTGYLNGAGLGDIPTGDNKRRLGAWDINGQVGYQGVNVIGEFVTTAQSANFGSSMGEGHVRAWDLGTNYTFNAGFIPNQSVVSFDYSAVKLASVENTQFVLGARNNVFTNVWAGLEYAFSRITDYGSVGKTSINALRFDVTASF